MTDGSGGHSHTQGLLHAIAAHGLRTSTLELPEGVDDATWRALLAGARTHRLSGHLMAAISEGPLQVSQDQVDQAASQHAAAMASSLWLEQLLLEVVERFDAEGVDHRVLKGCAVAHLDYPDPAVRSFGDVDLLVRSEHIDEAVRILTTAGYRRGFPEPRPGFDRRFTKGAAFVSPAGLELDLHRTLALGPFGLMIDLDDLWTPPAPYELGGRALRAMARPQRLLHACYHAALGNPTPRLVALRDVAQMLEDTSDADVELVLQVADRWGGTIVLTRALSLAATVLGLAEPAWTPRLARLGPPTRRHQRALATYVDPALGSTSRSIAALRAIPGLGPKASYLRALAFPSHPELAGGARRRWRRVSTTLVRMVRRPTTGSPEPHHRADRRIGPGPQQQPPPPT
jgi:hypothetical protein